MAQEEKRVPEKCSLQPPIRVALGTVSESWAGGSVAVTTPSIKAAWSTKALACILSGKGSCRPSPKLNQIRTSESWPFLGRRSRPCRAPTPKSTLNLAPGAPCGQSGLWQGRARRRPERGGARRPSDLIPSTPALLWELMQDDRSLIWLQSCPAPAVGFGRPFGKSTGPGPQLLGQEHTPTWGRGRCEGCGPVCP